MSRNDRWPPSRYDDNSSKRLNLISQIIVIRLLHLTDNSRPFQIQSHLIY